MKTKNYLMTSILSVAILVASAIGIAAQHSQHHSKKGNGQVMKTDMAKMMKSPHHMLMMAHMKSMASFTKTLRDQAIKPGALNVEFARGAVSEIRHNFDAIDVIHQNQMQAMSAEMKAKMKMMMEKMDKSQAMVKEHITELETVVRADQPNSKQVVMHTNALLKQFEMMSKMGGGNKATKKMPMKMKPM